MEQKINNVNVYSDIKLPIEDNMKLKPTPNDKTSFDRLLNIKNNIIRFVNENNNLLIYSNKVGNGKTSWSKKILIAYLNSVFEKRINYLTEKYKDKEVGYLWYEDERNKYAMFMNVSDFLNYAKKNISENNSRETYHLMDKLIDTKLLVLDDIGAVKTSTYDNQMLFEVINQRYSQGKSTIYTSNLSIEDLSNVFDARIADRIRSSVIIEFKDVSNRESNSNW